MIIAVTTTIKCDGVGCTKAATVTIQAGNIENSAKGWLSGKVLTFCSKCRTRLCNQAAIESDKTDRSETVVLPFVSSQNGGADHAA